jgi:HEXXH motif-containing protein
MFGSFFSPMVVAPADFFDEVIAAYVAATLERARTRLDSAQLGVLEGHCATGFVPHPVIKGWSPEMGHLNCLLRSRERESISLAAAQFLLCAIAAGAKCDATIATISGAILYFNGYRIVTGAHTSLRFDGTVFTLNSERGSESFRLLASVWLRDGVDDAQIDPMRYASAELIILAGEHEDPELHAPGDRVLQAHEFPQALRQLQESLDIIATVSPGYSAWCRRVLRQVQVVGSERLDVSLSRSSPARPGSIVVSHGASLVQYMESLIHECTHQYYYMVSILTPIKRDANDTSLYYSPIIFKHRPIDRILLAYHATANILFFLEVLQVACPALARMTGIRIALHRQICGQLLETLLANAGALSESANEFWAGSTEQVSELIQRTG